MVAFGALSGWLGHRFAYAFWLLLHPPLFEVMGDAELRPFVNSLIGNLVAQEIKTDDCLAVERGLEILDPLPADNVAQLIGFLVEMGQRGDDEEDGEEEIAE